MDNLTILQALNKLPIEKRILYNQTCKNKLIAYLLLVFIGGIGAHRFYLGLVGSGFCILALSIIGFLLPPVYIAVVIWLIIDLFYVNHYTNTLRADILKELSKEA